MPELVVNIIWITDDRLAKLGPFKVIDVASDTIETFAPGFKHLILLFNNICCAPVAVDPVSVACLLFIVVNMLVVPLIRFPETVKLLAVAVPVNAGLAKGANDDKEVVLALLLNSVNIFVVPWIRSRNS